MDWSILMISCIYFAYGNIITRDDEEKRTELMVDLIKYNLKSNGWTNILCLGHFSDGFYSRLRNVPLTITVANWDDEIAEIDDIVPYKSNVVIISCNTLEELKDGIMRALSYPFFHQQSNIVLYYHAKDKREVPRLLFIFWYYSACNAIVVQYDDYKETLEISLYNPFIFSDKFKMHRNFGCWKTTKIHYPITTYEESFQCEEGCHNVSLNSLLRVRHLGTCMGIETHKVQYEDTERLKSLQLFEDKGKNLHGYVMRAHTIEVKPFLLINENPDGSYTMQSRDGMVWTAASQLMNFTIDFTPTKDIMKKPFNFEDNIQLIVTFARREADLLLFPIYLFDIVLVEIDLSIAYKDSGVCIMSHRAGFETILFDIKLLQDNYTLAIHFAVCFMCIWLLFFAANCMEKGTSSFDQFGKDYINTIRNVLSISLHNPPKRESFRIFLTISIWSFFLINFTTQAAIISFFTASKRGKDVETFDDVIEKGYVVEGMASPDMMLPETEERFQKINSKLVALHNLYDCVNSMTNDTRRFCLIDCSVGRYLERNRLNEKGEQYLHIAEDRIHSHYLTMIFHKNSPLTYTFNKYLRRFFEAGLIKKWEQYRYTDIKEEAQVKPLSLVDLIGIFKCYYMLLGLSSIVFILEVVIGMFGLGKRYFILKFRQWHRTRAAKKKLKLEWKAGNIIHVNIATQTAELT